MRGGHKTSPSLAALKGQRVLVAASTGGHLEQAVRWADRLALDPDSLFVTFDSEQAKGLLRDRRSFFVPYIAPRDLRGAIAGTRHIDALLRKGPYSAVMSTGAALALSAYAPAALRGRPFYYVESVSRFLGPSVSGRLLSHLPFARTFTQHEAYASRHWQLVDGLLSDYAVNSANRSSDGPLRVFVTLGTIRPYRFDALVDGVVRSLTQHDNVVWQLGITDRRDLPGDVHDFVTAAEFDEQAMLADVVITHAGVGSILRLLELGISPIVVPRRPERREHVDDHQAQVATALAHLGLVTMSEAPQLSEQLVHEPRPAVQRQDAEGDADDLC
jgi:UDP-N-acetylglucosamine--N-acetylmuramyl-(pentapeptide) pyrophosphoryl-undecaprenol N-acetylglucosamine transferase